MNCCKVSAFFSGKFCIRLCFRLDGCATLKVQSPLTSGAIWYSSFEKDCLTYGEKLTRQCRKVLWVMVVFTVPWVNFKVIQRGGGKQRYHVFVFFSFLVAESPWNSIKQSQTVTTHNTNRHCRVRFYTFVGQPLSKQLYIKGFPHPVGTFTNTSLPLRNSATAFSCCGFRF